MFQGHLVCQTDTAYLINIIIRYTALHNNTNYTYVIRITMQMTVVVTKNAYAEDTRWIVWDFGYILLLYSWKRHDGRAHRTQPSRRGSEKSVRCPLKAPQKPGEITFFSPILTVLHAHAYTHPQYIIIYRVLRRDCAVLVT